MKKVCLNSKNYNLTEGKEYEIITELEEFVSVINDKGLVRSYSSNLFGEIEEEPILKIEDLNWDIYIENEDLLSITLTLGEKSGIVEVVINFQTISGNCGIADIEGVNYIYSKLLDTVSSFGFEEIEDTVKNIFEDVITELHEEISNQNKAIMVISTNKEFPQIWEILDNWADLSTKTVINPNSDNEIKMWIKYLV